MANHWSPKPGLEVQVLPLPSCKKMINKLIQFLKETRSETKKVVWPDRRYVMVATAVILVLVVITSIYVMSIDIIFTRIFGLLLK